VVKSGGFEIVNLVKLTDRTRSGAFHDKSVGRERREKSIYPRKNKACSGAGSEKKSSVIFRDLSSFYAQALTKIREPKTYFSSNVTSLTRLL
jgi:hypothetical protein